MNIRNLKMRTVIISIVAIVVVIGISILCILAARNSNTMLRDKINDNMSTYLAAQENTIEKFVNDSEQNLILFSKSDVVKGLIKNDLNDVSVNGTDRTLPEFNDESYNTTAYYKDHYSNFESAQSYTLDYYSALQNWEGLYIGNFETRILAYTAPPVIGKILRADPDKRDALINELKANPDKVYNAGIIVSPGTGQLCLSMYAPIFEDGTFLGYVGGGVFNTELESILADNTITGITDSDFFMFNCANGTLFTSTDASEQEFVAQETENPMLREVMTRISDGKENDHFEYNDENYKDGETVVVNYKTVSGRDWAVVVCAKKSVLYEASNKNLRNMIITSLITFAAILLLVSLAITVLTKPLGQITSAVKAIGQLKLEKNEDVIHLAKNKNEVGVISREIEELRKSLREIVETLKGCSSSLDSSAGNMANNSKDLVGFVSDNTATTEQLAASLTSTGSIVDKVNGNIGEMNELVEKVVKSVNEGSEHSGKILANAESMEKKSAQTLIESKRNITENKAAIQDVMVKLRTLSKINTFVNDILSIATQTKLLSLNASIEAARAGEQGKGFAVVATEIGTLASNTSSAAQKIQDITRLTNESVDETVKCFDELNEYLETDIMSKFEEFNKEAQNNNKITIELISNINEVSRSVNEFKKFVNELVNQMDDIRMLSEQNSSGIDDIVEKNEHTSNIADNMAHSVASNKENAQALSEIISRFSVN